MIKKLFLPLILVLFSVSTLYGKKVITTEDKINSAYIYLLSKNTKWPNEHRFEKFHIAIVSKTSRTYDAFVELVQGLRLKSKPIDVQQVSFSQIQYNYDNFEVIFLSKEYKDALKELYRMIPKDYPVLIISDGAENKNYMMINLYKDKYNKKNITINKYNLSSHNLSINNQILLAGEEEVGISKLYESSLEALKKQEEAYRKFKEKNIELQKKISTNNTYILKLTKMMSNLKKKISTKEAELEKKQKYLDKKDKEIQKVLKQLKQKQQKLEYKKRVLQQLQNEYIQLKNKLLKQEKLLEQREEKLREQQAILIQRQSSIAELDKTITKQHEIINRQKDLIHLKVAELEKQSTITTLLYVILVLLLMFVWFMFRAKRRYEKLTKELAVAKESAESANQSKSIFLSNMSHELRTPLNAILGFSQLLLQDDAIPQNKKETLGNINKAGKFLLSLINDVLELSKIEAGKIILHPKPNDISYIAQEALEFIQPKVQEKGLTLYLDANSRFPECAILDGDKFRQIILNYLSNAVKYSEQGEVKLHIDYHNSTHMIFISVSDEGSGITEENLKKIFQPFTQVGKASEETGTGLGLSITKKYAQALGGDVGVVSSFGKGSTFKATVSYKPCKKEDITKPSEALQPQDIIGIATDRDIKILIADDKEENRKLLYDILKKLHCSLYEAKDGREAIEIFKKHPIDLIWMDRKMPILNGEEATKIIRSLPAGHNVAIAMVTANAFEEDKQRLYALGVDDILIKPYSIEDIYEMMQKLLNLQYLYKHEQHTHSPTDIVYTQEEFTKELAMLHANELDELYQTALLLNTEKLREFIEQKRTSHERLAAMLDDVQKHLEFHKLIKTIQDIQKN